MGILPTPSFGVNEEFHQGSPERRTRSKAYFAVVGLGLWVLWLVPPLSTWGNRYEFAQALQFGLFAFAVPALLVAGHPWRWLGLASGRPLPIESDGALAAGAALGPLDRIAYSRLHQLGHRRAVLLEMVFVAQTIFWRSSPVANALVRHPWLEVIESLALVGAGVLLWLDLIESVPFRPRTTRPYRIGMSAIAMWTVWVTAYLMAMSHNSWYPAIRHVAGEGLSQSADQQLSAAIMWFMSAAAFLPVVFSNLNRWLQSEDDPDEELYQLVRQHRTRGFFGTNP
jgi:cytochrome c oxidase assembly factor CtaG